MCTLEVLHQSYRLSSVVAVFLCQTYSAFSLVSNVSGLQLYRIFGYYIGVNNLTELVDIGPAVYLKVFSTEKSWSLK